MIAFISSNKWLRAAYGGPLRKKLSSTLDIKSITDFGELPIFETAATFPMVFVAKKGSGQESFKFTQVPDLNAPYPDVLKLIDEMGDLLPSENLLGESWMLSSLAGSTAISKMQAASVSLAEYLGEHFYYGIKSGLTEAFTITSAERLQLIKESSACKRVLKPLLVGDDIRKWSADPKGKWLIYMPHGVETDGLEPILRHLKPYKQCLESRATSQRWYELQQPQARYAGQFSKPKIVFPDIAKESRFTLDSKGCYISNTAYAIGSDDLFLLSVLNSEAVWNYVRTKFSCLGDPNAAGRFRFFFQFVSQIPIPKASATDMSVLAQLCQNCLHNAGVGCAEQETEMNARINRLYGGIS